MEFATCASRRDHTAVAEPRILRRDDLETIERGSGVRTKPFVGKWNSERAQITTGTTEFPPGAELPLHTHNVDESVVILEGEALVFVEEEAAEIAAGDATWIPAGVPHAFRNRGSGTLRILWIYAGRDVTRTIVESGETFEHLSGGDRTLARRSG